MSRREQKLAPRLRTAKSRGKMASRIQSVVADFPLRTTAADERKLETWEVQIAR
jgi:hypothetical protein